MNGKIFPPVAVTVAIVVAVMAAVFVITGTWPATARWITVGGLVVAIAGILIGAIRRRTN